MGKSLVLVVGAGASKEVNLPVGAELRTQIAEALDIRYEYGRRQISGSEEIDDAFREIAGNLSPPSNNIESYVASSWRIRDAMPQAISIDNFIDSHREDENIRICGKLAIASCILAAEADSALSVDRIERYPKIDFSSVESTWFNAFFQLLTENCREQEIEARLDQVAIISFNYDRCIEHYLHGALQNYYGVTPKRAAEALKRLQVFHPYGSVGPLPWQQPGGIEFGASVHGRQLINVSKGIRTFTEGTDPESSDVESIQSLLKQASRIAFLGFAFHRLNLSLLFPGVADGSQAPVRPAYATGLGISLADGEEITKELSQRGAVALGQFRFRNDLTCAKLFTEYWRSLGLS